MNTPTTPSERPETIVAAFAAAALAARDDLPAVRELLDGIAPDVLRVVVLELATIPAAIYRQHGCDPVAHLEAATARAAAMAAAGEFAPGADR